MFQYTYDDMALGYVWKCYENATNTTSGTFYTTTPIYQYACNQWTPCYVSELISESEKMPEEFDDTQLAEIDLFE